MVVSLNYCSQNGGNLYRAPYYNRNPNIGLGVIRNLDQYPHGAFVLENLDSSGPLPDGVRKLGAIILLGFVAWVPKSYNHLP